MKKIIMIIGSVAAALLTMQSHAQISAANSALAQEAFSDNGCISCHDASSRVVGPSLQEIAKRYKGKKVVAEMAARIRNGSVGKWGGISQHPGYEPIDDHTARLIAAWILAGSPQ